MANIDVRKNERPSVAQARDWDPSSLMRSLLGWDPFREMAPFTLEHPTAGFAPAFEVKETKDGYLFKADLPGVAQQDVEVSYAGNRLTIRGKREAEKQDKTDTYYAYERSYGSFTRAFTLPEGVEPAGIHADLRDGVLTIAVPKKAEAQPRKIAVATPQDERKA